MYKKMMRYGGALFFAGALALAGCSGDDGSAGAPGQNGTDGTDGTDGTNGTDGKDLTAVAKPESCAVCHSGAGGQHQAIYNDYKDSDLVATIDGVASTDNGDGTFSSTVTFTVKQNGQPVTDLSALNAPTITASPFPGRGFGTSYVPTGTTPTPTATAGQFTVTKTDMAFDPKAGEAFVYVAFTDGTAVANAKGRVTLYPDVAYDGVASPGLTYASAANVTGCEKCHGAPYKKHGNILAKVEGLPEFTTCQACHSPLNAGGHADWQLLVDDPLAYANAPRKADGTVILTEAQATKYAYNRTLMNDVHMSHAMEFAYPQTMANCVTCHEGKLDVILTDANFNLTTCKSCHPVTGSDTYADAKRAPALTKILPPTIGAHTADLYTSPSTCNSCHKPVSLGGFAPTFADIHAGYNKTIYSAEGTKHSTAVTTKVDSATFDAATNKLTVAFSAEGIAATDTVKPTVVISLYGYDTKDFIVGGHASQPQPDGKRNLEWAEGASGNSPRLQVAPATATAGNKTWTATADLSLWAGMISDGVVKRVEIGFLPKLDPKAVAGVTKTFDLVGNAIVEDKDAYGKAIVDTAKCNACHEALATTFHSPNYGSAGVVACRLCHVVGSGGSHLEMQSRSIDSYVHAIHSMQPFDSGKVDFTDPVAKLRYEHHVGSQYPYFTTLSCESCHNAGTYDVPDQAKSLGSVLSAANTVTSPDRTIGAVPSYVVGPASRACGSCHRAGMINENRAGDLAAFNEHTSSFGYLLETAPGVLDAAIAKIMAVFK